MGIIPKTSKIFVNKDILTFSIFFFLVVSLAAITAYAISSRQINHSYVEQQLALASETTRLRLAKIVNSELALVLKMADTPVIRQYFLNPFNSEYKALAFNEFAIYQHYFEQKILFWVNDVDKIFYSTGNDSFVLDPDDPDSYWYNLTLFNTEKYNFNINYNPNLQQINLWVNVPVFTEENGIKKPLGMLGTGINLTKFSDFIINSYNEFDTNIILYTFNKSGEITSAADYMLANKKVRLEDHLGTAGTELVRFAEMLPDGESISYIYGNKKYLINSIPEMEWNLAVIYPLPGLLSLNQSMNTLFFCMLFLIFIILIVINIIVARSEKAMSDQNIQLIEANEKAESASRTKSNFLATMSHEIRTPLNAIMGIAQVEMQDTTLPDKHMIAYEKIQSSGSSLLAIINDILDMSKIETGKLELNPVLYSVPDMINDAVQLNIVRIGSKPIEFLLNINENLPSYLFGDELRIKQILNNLLSNAIKYTGKGQVSLSVGYKNDNENIILEFIVKDTGQGIKEEDVKKLFSSEYQRFNADANRTTEGTGLGLNITKSIVEMMNGIITVDSEYGKGSTFAASVRQKINEYTPIGKEIAQKLGSFNYSVKKETEKITRELMPYGSVLVVDDVDTNLYVAHGILTLYNLDVELAGSGFSAIEKVESGKRYDIIFMDHMMPQMDGIETTHKLREMGYEGTIIALTANALAGNEAMFAQKGFDGFIPKPINAMQLNNALNKFIRDKYPEEAKKYKPQVFTQTETKEIAPKLRKIFCDDARKAAVTLRKTSDFNSETGDINLYRISVHAMKTALKIVNEEDASRSARALENAARENDFNYIINNTDSFIKVLEKIIIKLSFDENKKEDNTDIMEDKTFLKEQMQKIKTACENYDDDAAYAVINKLRENKWRAETTDLIEKVHDMLYVYSDFEGVIKKINTV